MHRAPKSSRQKLLALILLLLALPLLTTYARSTGVRQVDSPATPRRAQQIWLPQAQVAPAELVALPPFAAPAPFEQARRPVFMPAAPAPPELPPPPDPAFDALRADLTAMVAAWPGEHAVSVLDIATGRMISVNGERPQLAACTIKIPVLVAVAQDLEAGRYRMEDVDALVRSAMGPSNTWPARELLRISGGDDVGAGVHRANAIMAQLGAQRSLLTHAPGYYWEEYGYAASHGVVNNLLTSDDLVRMLAAIYEREAVSPLVGDYVLWSMGLAPAWMNKSLGAPLPAGVELYHKVGQLYGPFNTWNDAGIIVYERDGERRAYAIAYLGSYDAGWQASYSHAQQVSARVWQYFGER